MPVVTAKMTTSTTMSTPNVEVDLSKLQSEKGFNISEVGSRSSTAKPVTTSDPKDKGKGVHVEPTTEEKKKFQELEMERLRHLNNMMRLRVNDPPCLNKGDPNKVWCYETIESATYGENDDFL